MSYVPLNMPTMGSTGDYADTAAWIAASAAAINGAAQSFMQDLSFLSSENFTLLDQLPLFTSVVTFGSITGIGDRPVRPTIGTADFASLLERLGQLTPPDAPTDGFTYTDPGYASILRDPLLQKLLLDLANGGYGIETADEDALWARARDREALAYQAHVEEIKRQAATSSFPMPQGALTSALARAAQEYASKTSSASRDIALKRSEMYVENRRFTIEKVLASESQSIELYNAIQNRAMQAAQVEVTLAVALFDAGIKLFAAQQESLLKQINAPLEIDRQKVALYAADTSAYAAFVNAVATAANVDIQNSVNTLHRDIEAHKSAVEKVKYKLQQVALTIELRKEIAKFGTEFFRTALGSAINGINGLAVQSGEV